MTKINPLEVPAKVIDKFPYRRLFHEEDTMNSTKRYTKFLLMRPHIYKEPEMFALFGLLKVTLRVLTKLGISPHTKTAIFEVIAAR